MTIPPKYIYLSLLLIILSLSTLLYFKWNSGDKGLKEIERQNKEYEKNIARMDRIMHDAMVERGLRKDTVRIIEKTIVKNNTKYVQEIIDISGLDYDGQDSLYRINAAAFDRQFANGQFSPKN